MQGFLFVFYELFQKNISLKRFNGDISSFFASSFASIPEIASFIFGFFAALSMNMFSKNLFEPSFCMLYDVFNSGPIVSQSSLSYISRFFSDTSFSFRHLAMCFAANFPDVIAFPTPSPVNGSTSEAASPTNTHPLPWFFLWCDPNGSVHTFIPCGSIFAFLNLSLKIGLFVIISSCVFFRSSFLFCFSLVSMPSPTFAQPLPNGNIQKYPGCMLSTKRISMLLVNPVMFS